VSSFDAFDQLVLGSVYPMFIVTATAEDRAGCLVGFATQASINPRRLVVMLSKANHTFRIAGRVDHLAVHFLGHGDQRLATLFGEETGDDTDKFSRCGWTDGPEGTTLVQGTRGWAVGRVLERFDAGDHVAHLLDVVAAQVERGDAPLTAIDVSGLDPGHPA
jgi:flavin reductase (DIM6/NTAB) family NADH-FMN oxidoreductase RutF